MTAHPQPEPCACPELCSLLREEKKKAKAERERVLPLVLKAKETQLALFRMCWDKNTIELVKQVGMDIRAIEESLRQQAGEQE